MIDTPLGFSLIGSITVCVIVYFILKEQNRYNQNREEMRNDLLGLFVVIFGSIFCIKMFSGETISHGTQLVPKSLDLKSTKCPF
jgi:hypothetical protein